LEIHNVSTEDGYVLRLYRIPGGKNEINYKEKVKPPVFFQHGLVDSSDGWFSNINEKNCIPFILANLGFDIWLGNSRGNKHSKHNINLSPKEQAFWAFSFHELAQYDIPACFDFIFKLNKSGEKIIYFGHSQGTTIMFSAISFMLEYIKSKCKMFIALAPVANLSNIDSHLPKLIKNLELDKFFLENHIYEFLPYNTESIKSNISLLDNINNVFHAALSLLTDKNSQEINDNESVKRYFSHYPNGSSYKCVNHFTQIIRNKRFCYYDYGFEANMEIYKSPTPPDYKLTNVKDFPIVLCVGTEDRLATMKDAIWLKENLKENVIKLIEIPKAGHLTFHAAKDISWFEDVLKIISKISDKNIKRSNPENTNEIEAKNDEK